MGPLLLRGKPYNFCETKMQITNHNKNCKYSKMMIAGNYILVHFCQLLTNKKKVLSLEHSHEKVSYLLLLCTEVLFQ